MLGFESILKSFILWLTILPFLPILLPLFLLLIIYRQIVIQLSRIFRPDLQSPLDGLDVAFALDDFWTSPKGATSFIWILKEKTDPELILRRFEKALEAPYDYTRLTSVFPEFWMGYPFWKKSEVEFRMEDHVKVFKPQQNHPPYPNENQSSQSSLFGSCGSISSEEDFNINTFLCSWMRSGFTKGLPLWEIMVIPDISENSKNPKICEDIKLLFPQKDGENKTKNIIGNNRIFNPGEKSSLIALKIHHVIGDGYSKLRLLEKIVDPWESARDSVDLDFLDHDLQQSVSTQQQSKESHHPTQQGLI